MMVCSLCRMEVFEDEFVLVLSRASLGRVLKQGAWNLVKTYDIGEATICVSCLRRAKRADDDADESDANSFLYDYVAVLKDVRALNKKMRRRPRRKRARTEAFAQRAIAIPE